MLKKCIKYLTIGLLLLNNNYFFTQTAKNPVAKFTFDQKNSIDEISKRSAKLVGVSFTEDRFGNDGNAVYLFGNEFSYVNLGNHKELKPKVGSISLWVKIELEVFSGNGIVVNPVLLTKNSENDDFFESYCIYYAYETNRIQASSTLDSVRQVSIYAMREFSRFKWHHLVVTYDFDSLSFYIDGKIEGRMPKKFETKFQPTDSVLIGVTGNKKNNRFLNGIIDDVLFYDYVLSPTEISELYNVPNPNRRKVFLQWILLALGFILLVLVIYLFIRHRLKVTLKKEKERLELYNIVLETELRVNRALMNPHFVFNSLNALQNFILKNENDRANNYLVKFSKLMRKILENNMSDVITLEFEIELLERYLEIEDLRFEENVKHSITVDPDVNPSVIRIPIMMIQPFIENAIWHGLLKKPGEKMLQISFSKIENKYILCIIEDNGTGRKKHTHEISEKQSLAIGFIRQRLSLLNQIHQLECSLTIEDKPGNTGTIVKILLPILNNK
jgi:hypothetical protein